MTTFTEEEQRQNLRNLAEYLLTGKTRMIFDMRVVCIDAPVETIALVDYLAYYDCTPFDHTCGTVGCALGHAPEATGIPGLPDENWHVYSKRVFGLINRDTCYSMDAWYWCFSGEWSRTDNTPEGAGKRILYYLDHGLPKDWYEQLYKGAALCY